MSALNLTELNTALGAYYRANRGILIGELTLGANFQNRFEVWDSVKDELPLPKLSIADIVKPGNTTFNATANAIVHSARIAKVRHCKVDLLITPSEYETTWLGNLRKNGQNNSDMPLQQFIFNSVFAKANENIYRTAIYGGTHNASGTSSIDVMDGFLKIIADEITATNLTPVVTGAITSTNVEAKLLSVYDALDEAYKNVPVEMKVNAQIYDWYIRQQRSTYGGNVDYQIRTSLYGTSCTLIREPGLGTSQRLICTPKNNMVYVTDSQSDSSTVDTQIFDRSIKLLIDFKAGVQFKEVNNNVLTVNDQV